MNVTPKEGKMTVMEKNREETGRELSLRFRLSLGYFRWSSVPCSRRSPPFLTSSLGSSRRFTPLTRRKEWVNGGGNRRDKRTEGRGERNRLTTDPQSHHSSSSGSARFVWSPSLYEFRRPSSASPSRSERRRVGVRNEEVNSRDESDRSETQPRECS